MSKLYSLLERLDLETKVRLMTGADHWSTVAVDEIGLESMALSDGPVGVRGVVWDEREPSLNLPSGGSLASMWDADLAHEYGEHLAAEARRKKVAWVLGPTMNLHRSPLGGRHFECLSEDPFHTGVIASAYVQGIQKYGVAATPKHYIANDFETNRFTVDVRLDERTLRELYMLPFEMVVAAGAWSIMSSYNSVNGTTMSESDLLQSPLRDEWGFEGVVVSDWTAVRSVAAAAAEQDLEMPGPGYWSEHLLDAVRSGEISEDVIDRHVLRLLQLALKVGALKADSIHIEDHTTQPEVSASKQANRARSEESSPITTHTLRASERTDFPSIDEGVAFARRACAEGSVLVRNNGILPLSAQQLNRVAVIGYNAEIARTQGGGSATVLPEKVVSPLAGLEAALPAATITYSVGALVAEDLVPLQLERMRNPRTGKNGVAITFYNEAGEQIFTEDRFTTDISWVGGDAPVETAHSLTFETQYTSPRDETIELGFATPVRGRIFVDGQQILEAHNASEVRDLGAALATGEAKTASASFEAGKTRTLRYEFDLYTDVRPARPTIGVHVGTVAVDEDPDALIAQAAQTAAQAEVAIVVVGTNSSVESEAQDRTHLNLPGHQDALVRAVAKANPRTIVVVNSGAPVLMPWRNDVAAILIGWFGGQEFGNALADVLLGHAEPGGRLPTTWPEEVTEITALSCTPDAENSVTYAEGIHIGYRAYEKHAVQPAYPFGFGLGYTTWSVGEARVERERDATLRLIVPVTNTGERTGKYVVQVYARKRDSRIERPARWLVGFAPVHLSPGENTEVSVHIEPQRFAHWDGEWLIEPGKYELIVAENATDEGYTLLVELGHK